MAPPVPSPLWQKHPSLEEMQIACNHTLVQCLGIEFTEIGADFVEARMPVDERTMQPMGLLHGGASAALAETLGGAGAYLAVPEGTICLGLEINANHLRPAPRGWVIGLATPIHIGRTTQVWQIDMCNEAGQPTCVSRITMAVLAPQ